MQIIIQVKKRGGKILGRRAEPIEIIKAKGKSHHLTKKEVERRKTSEVKIKSKKLIAPEYVKNDLVAFSKWKELTNLFKDVEAVATTDSGELARYCKHYSEYIELMEQREFVKKFDVNWEKYCMDVTEFVQDGVNRFLRLDPLMKLEGLINKKSDLLTKLEDRLFLNPISRIKNVPKKEEEKKDPSVSMFGG
jgi:phage terminase small subunit